MLLHNIPCSGEDRGKVLQPGMGVCGRVGWVDWVAVVLPQLSSLEGGCNESGRWSQGGMGESSAWSEM